MKAVEVAAADLEKGQIVLDISLGGSLCPCMFRVVDKNVEEGDLNLEFISKVNNKGNKIDSPSPYSIDSTGFTPFTLYGVFYLVVED